MKKIFKNNKISRVKAFTLIELLVVIAIISLLSAVILSSLSSARMKANDTKIAQDLRQFKIAAELYYNDYRVYPNTAMDYKSKAFAVDSKEKDSWSHKLAFFVKTAEAATSHSITKLCVNFDIAAAKMVEKKYLSSIPVHPYDNDASGVCYKAVKSTSTNSFASYAALTSQVRLSNGSKISKRAGFVVGDTTKDGILAIIDAEEAVSSPDDIEYPAGLDGDDPYATGSEEFVSVDAVDGMTNGTVVHITVADCKNGEFFDPYTETCRIPFTGTRDASASCVYPLMASFYSDSCVPIEENPMPQIPVPPPVYLPLP